MLFRPMELKDKDEMKALFDSLSELSMLYFNRNRDGNEVHTMKFFEGGSRQFEYYVAEDEDSGHILGYCFTWEMQKKIPWFGICVNQAWHGKHVGTFLLTQTIEMLKKRGYGGLLLTTATNNFKGQALYEKCGFEKLGLHTSLEFLYLNRFEY